MRISKKIFTIILSISLLVVISCGDRPTGSMPNDGSIPKITGTERVTLTTDLILKDEKGSGLTVKPVKDGALELDAETEQYFFGSYNEIPISKNGIAGADWELYWKDDGKTIMEANELDQDDTSKVISYLKITFSKTPDPFSSGITASVEVYHELPEDSYGAAYVGKNTTHYTVSEAQVP